MNHPLGTVHYLRAGGAGDFEGDHLFLASRQGGHFFWRKFFLKPENFPRG